MKDIEKIMKVIEEIRPFIQNDGGDLEFVKYEDGKVYIKMLGACQNCSMAQVTLKEGIETAIKNEVPAVEEVINLND